MMRVSQFFPLLAIIALCCGCSEDATAPDNKQVSLPPGDGSVSGMVWDDADHNGERAGYEWPLADVVIVLEYEDDVSQNWQAMTDSDGAYRFSQIPVGVYKVRWAQSNDLPYASTTTEQMTIEITENEGVFSDVTGADFGCVIDGVEEGDFLIMSGYHDIVIPPSAVASASPTFVGRHVRFVDCTPLPEPCERPECPCGDEVVETLCGSVADVREDRIWMMGNYFYLPQDGSQLHLSWQRGDRACIRIVDRVVVSIDAYDGDGERVSGVVREVARAGDTNYFITAGIIACVGYCSPPPQ